MNKEISYSDILDAMANLLLTADRQFLNLKAIKVERSLFSVLERYMLSSPYMMEDKVDVDYVLFDFMGYKVIPQLEDYANIIKLNDNIAFNTHPKEEQK